MEQPPPTPAELAAQVAEFDRVFLRTPFDALLAHCLDLHEQYVESDDPEVGFKLGHYNAETGEVVFYGVPSAATARFAEAVELDGVDFWMQVDRPDEEYTNVTLHTITASE
jgi:hypothetical protein